MLKLLLIIVIFRAIVGLLLIGYVRTQKEEYSAFNIPNESDTRAFLCLPPATGCFFSCLGKEVPVEGDANVCGYITYQCKGRVINSCDMSDARFRFVFWLFNYPLGFYLLEI